MIAQTSRIKDGLTIVALCYPILYLSSLSHVRDQGPIFIGVCKRALGACPAISITFQSARNVFELSKLLLESVIGEIHGFSYIKGMSKKHIYSEGFITYVDIIPKLSTFHVSGA